MAFNPDIRELIENYSSDGTNLTIPRASLPKLSSAEAHTSTGNSKKFLYALLHQIATAVEATEDADKSGRMVFRKTTPVSVADGIIRQGFEIYFDLALGDADVADEA